MAREVITLYTLFIDTHDKNVLIILFKDGKIFNMENILTTNKHSEVTMPTIDKVLSKSNVDIKEISSIIVVNGPGSFTGERIAVTIAKTFAYCLNIPIRVIDALSILALNVDRDIKNIALEDRNGAFIGTFDKNCNIIKPLQYLSKSLYIYFKEENEVIVDVDINYEKVYDYVMNIEPLNPHEVKPLYVKGISALNGK
ncbi:MAG: tRNA (adenosine(37)-N6)-threonylcarbamoyltransferase complex dimerization subunit type 1 TsaB [Candidatus Coprovivens sp.]